MTPQDAALLASLTGYVGNRWPRRMASDVAPDLHRIATEQAAENKRLRDAVAPIAAFAALVCASNMVDDFVLTMGSRLAATQLTVGHMRMLNAALQVQP